MTVTTRIAFLALGLALAGSACSGTTTKQATLAASPLAGTWARDGDVPAPKPAAPEFTQLTFAADGTLQASYVAAGGALAGIVKKAPKIQDEQDAYEIVDDKTVRITEGSSAREYTYDVHGGKLYLTPPGGGEAAIFSKTSS